MLDSFGNYFWTHPVAIAGAAIAVIIILIWMTGSGSRQRFITFKRTKETDQLARDLSRIAAALERIARSQETPTDYLGRRIPPGWEESISAGEPSEDVALQMPATANSETVEAAMATDAPGYATHGDGGRSQAAAQQSNAPTAHSANAAPVAPPPSHENQPTSGANPLGGTADLLGKKKLDLPNPLYRPK